MFKQSTFYISLFNGLSKTFIDDSILNNINQLKYTAPNPPTYIRNLHSNDVEDYLTFVTTNFMNRSDSMSLINKKTNQPILTNSPLIFDL